MSHLTPEELIDLIENLDPCDPIDGIDPIDREVLTQHLAACAECRHQFDDARQMIVAVSESSITEPSPLFWDHLSARVRDAIAAEESREAGRWWARWFGPNAWRVGTLAAAAAVAVLAVGVALRSGSSSDNLPASRPAALDRGAGHEATFAEVADVAAIGEASLGLLGGLAGDLSWDAASEAGLTTGRDAVDAVLMDLAPDERLELQRVLEEELSRGHGKVQS
jgi:hypothetical protein